MPINIPQSSILLFLLLLSPAAAQPSSDPQDPNFDTNINPSVGIVIIALVVSLFLLGFFSMYIRHCAGDSSSSSNPATRLAANAARSRRAPRGLDAAVIQSFPTFDYSSVKSLHIGKGALECAVCLNEFEDDETLRLIPKCDHVFHPDCIDAWLVSHTTCPVCRADLTPQPDDSPQLGQIDEAQTDQQPSPNHDSIIDVPTEPVPTETELMDRPLNPAALPPLNPKLNRSRTRASGRPRWLGRFARSNSTGHVAVKQWENMDRFTLRLPEDIRRQIISGKLNRTTSCVALPREGSSRRGPRSGPSGFVPVSGPVGEGSNRGRLFGSWGFDRAARSDRWMFSLAPPFVSRAPSVRSPKVAVSGGSVHSSKAGDSVHVFTVADPNLPPV